jgi:hypothetical protein
LECAEHVRALKAATCRRTRKQKQREEETQSPRAV